MKAVHAPPTLPKHVLSFLSKINITAGVSNPQEDPTLGLLDHIVECVGALRDINSVYRSMGSVDSRGVGTRALYGFYLELGKLVSDTISFNPPPEQAAAAEGFCHLSSSILRTFPDIAAKKNHSTGRVLLHTAAYKSSSAIGPKLVKMIIDAYPSGASQQDLTGALPLHWAASSDDISPAVVQELINIHADGAAAVDDTGSLPLHWAVDKDQTNDEVIDILLKACPAAAQQPGRDGMLPLHWAINRPKPSLPTTLALIRANPSALRSQSPDGLLPLHLAASQPAPDFGVIEILLRAYPDAARCLDAYGRYAIHLAASAASPNPDVVNTLIKACPEALAQGDAAGWLPLHLAAWASGGEAGPSLHVVRSIAEKYPAAARTPTRGGLLPLHCAVSVPSPSCEVAALLLALYPSAASTVAHGEPEGGPGFGRWTPLTRATERGLRPLAALLAAAGEEEDEDDDEEEKDGKERSVRHRSPPPRVLSQHRPLGGRGRGNMARGAGGRGISGPPNPAETSEVDDRSPSKPLSIRVIPQPSNKKYEQIDDELLDQQSPSSPLPLVIRSTAKNNSEVVEMSRGNPALDNSPVKSSAFTAPRGPTAKHLAESPASMRSKRPYPTIGFGSPGLTEEMV